MNRNFLTLSTVCLFLGCGGGSGEGVPAGGSGGGGSGGTVCAAVGNGCGDGGSGGLGVGGSSGQGGGGSSGSGIVEINITFGIENSCGFNCSLVAVGELRYLDVTGYERDGDAVDVSVQWTSEQPSIASVDGSGVVTALSAGTARIGATLASDSSVGDFQVLTVVE